jgi:hypothetical protein
MRFFHKQELSFWAWVIVLWFLLIMSIGMARCQALQTIPTELDAHLIAFDKPYGVFVRAYLGCHADASHIEECRIGTGTIDRKAWKNAREAAKRLFDLAEREGK